MPLATVPSLELAVTLRFLLVTEFNQHDRHIQFCKEPDSMEGYNRITRPEFAQEVRALVP